MKTTLNPFENAKRISEGTGGASPTVIEEMQAEISVLGSQNETQAQDITDIKAQLTELAGNYSTTEHKTGRKWVDGKDIYEITYSFNTTTANTKTDSGVTLPAIDSLIKLDGVLADAVPVFSNIDDKVGVMIEDNKLKYYVPTWATTLTMTVTMLYTKQSV